MKPGGSPLIILVTCVLVVLMGSALWTPAYERVFQQGPLQPLDRQAEVTVDSALKRALAAFALARATNAALSVVQGTELDLSPAGVGLTLTPGEVLDPVNDLIERFSWVMLASSTALGVQKFILAFGNWLSVRVLLVLGAALLLVGLWRSETGPGWRSLGGRLLLMALLLRLAIPLSALANQGVYRLFLEADYTEASQKLEVGREAMASTQSGWTALEPAPESGVWSSLKRSGEKLKEMVDVRAQLDALQQRASEMVEHILQLILVFVVNTILMPLVFLWALWRLAAAFFTKPFRRRVHALWREVLPPAKTAPKEF